MEEEEEEEEALDDHVQMGTTLSRYIWEIVTRGLLKKLFDLSCPSFGESGVEKFRPERHDSRRLLPREDSVQSLLLQFREGMRGLNPKRFRGVGFWVSV